MNKLPLPKMTNEPLGKRALVSPSGSSFAVSNLPQDKTPRMANTLKQKAHKSHRVRFRTDDACDGTSPRDYANLYDKYPQPEITIDGLREGAPSIGRKSERSIGRKSGKGTERKETLES
jgi:hypothetical protein